MPGNPGKPNGGIPGIIGGIPGIIGGIPGGISGTRNNYETVQMRVY